MSENVVYTKGWFDASRVIRNLPQPYCLLVDTPNVFHPTLPNIYVQVEPEAIIPIASYLIKKHPRYHTILTFHEDVLGSCKNARRYVYGTTWFSPDHYLHIDTSLKRYQISHLAGGKLFPNARGHLLRQEIHRHQDAFRGLPIVFYRSSQQSAIKDYGGNPLLSRVHKDKRELFETFQFAFVIENSRQYGYFTEKIMDCLLSKTIPIYWGCPNIRDYFDTTGWIVLEDTDLGSIRRSLDVLDPSYYSRYSETIEANHQTAQQYTDVYTNLDRAE